MARLLRSAQTIMPFDDVGEQVSITAEKVCAAFTSLADAAPEALSTAAATVGRLPPATGAAFMNAADAAADSLRTSSEAIRDGSGGLVNPTVLMSDLGGADLIPAMVAVTFVIFLLLLRLIVAIHRNWVATAAAEARTDDAGAKAASANRRTGEQPLEQSRRSAGSRSTFFSARDLLSLPSFRRDRAPQDTCGLNEGGLYSNEGEKADEESGANRMNTDTGSSPTGTSQQPIVRPLPPLRILGPSVTSLEYVVSQPPPEVPSIFATARYRSIHRKLILDMHHLTLGRCNPLKHPDIDPRDTNKYAAMDEGGYSSPRKGRLIMSEMTASRGANNEGVNGEMGVAGSGPLVDPRSKESREVSFEDQLDVKQTFDTPKVIPIASVLNTTAVSPAGCGSLEVTLDVTDQLWERQLMEDMQDPNKALAHIVALESNQRELMKDFLLDKDNAETSLAKSVPHDNDENDEGNLLTERGLGAPTVMPKDNSKSNPKSGTMNSDTSKAEEPTRTVAEEYTFDSAEDGAEFQSVVLALRLVGKEIRNMYQSLELLHMASDAFAGDEFVMHVPSKTVEGKKDRGERDDSDQSDCIRPARPGVAIDDIYRCLGEMPSVRRNLERFYRCHYPVDVQHHWEESEHGEHDADAIPSLLAAAAEQENSEDDIGNEMSADVYQKKRLVLGIVDFVRLFSPPPGIGAAPMPNPSAARKARENYDDAGIDGHKLRIVSAVAIRKRVAKAAVRVRAYVNGMKIVRTGWTVPSDGREANLPIYQQRLAFDDEIENIRRDCSTKNEFYEATVGRDVRCNTHDSRHLIEKGSSRPSSYQGFALVGCHIFQLPDDTDPAARIHPLQSKNDPIAALPSLRKIIETNPEQEFFVQAFFSEKKKVALVALFVKTLPRGVDAAFDSVIDKFVTGNRTIRDRKLEVFLQLGPGSELPGSVWVALKVINWILRFSRRGEGDIPVLSSNVRTPFPGMRLSTYAETKHFGGSLRTNDDLPKNYVASTARFDEEALQNPIMKALFNTLESNALKHCVFDASFVLEGQRMDELPERVLGTVRLVHVNALECALPLSYSSTGEIAAEAEINEGDESTSNLRGSSWFLRGITQSTMNMFGIESPQRGVESNSEVQSRHRDGTINASQNADPYKRDLDALEEILDGVMVPVRKVNLKGVGLVPRTGAPTGAGEWTGAVESNAVSNHPRTPRTANGLKIGEAELRNIPVLQTYSRKDLTRFYLACYGDLKSTAIRVVESAAWRGLTFPIDTRACRIELRSNQIVQFGSDIQGNPVFYFRNMCLGPWRKDVDATLLATLHRVETSMKTLSASNPSVKCAVVILMGKPVLGDSTNLRQGGETDEKGDIATSATSNVQDDSFTTNSNGDEKKEDDNGNSTSEEKIKQSPYILGSDPRIDASEKYTVHTNATLIQRIVHTLSTHYPERLAKCLIVPSNGFEKTIGSLTIRTYVPSLRTRSRITILESASDLRDYISDENLLSFVGGKALLPPESLE